MNHSCPLIRDGKRGEENCINGNWEQGDLGQVRPEFELPPPLAGWQKRDTEVPD
jgi:hypothetical protein